MKNCAKILSSSRKTFATKAAFYILTNDHTLLILLIWKMKVFFAHVQGENAECEAGVVGMNFTVEE
jgi:hypothetical protein